MEIDGYLELSWSLEIPKRLFRLEEALCFRISEASRLVGDDALTVELSRLAMMHGGFGAMFAELFSPPIPTGLVLPNSGAERLTLLVDALAEVANDAGEGAAAILDGAVYPSMRAIYEGISLSLVGTSAMNLARAFRNAALEIEFRSRAILGADLEGNPEVLDRFRLLLLGS